MRRLIEDALLPHAHCLPGDSFQRRLISGAVQVNPLSISQRRLLCEHEKIEVLPYLSFMSAAALLGCLRGAQKVSFRRVLSLQRPIRPSRRPAWSTFRKAGGSLLRGSIKQFSFIFAA